MSTIKFSKTHNLVAFLEKPAEIKTINEDAQIRALVDRKKIIVTEASIRHDLQLQDYEGTECLSNDTIFEELARLRFIQVFVNHQLGDMSHHKKIFIIPSLTKKVFANMKREGKGFSGIITPLFETMMVQAPEEVGEGSERVKKLEKKKKSRTSGLKRLWKVGSTTRVESSEDKESLSDHDDASKQGRMIDNIDQNKEITLVDETQWMMNEEKMFGVNDLDGDEVIVDATAGEEVEHSTKVAEKEVSTADPVTTAGEVVTTVEDVKVATATTTPQISKNELTLAQTLIEIKAAKPKAIGAKDKGKEIMVEPKKPLKNNDQITFDEEVARKLEAQMKAKMEEEERITREKDEANIAMIEQWDEVQAKTDADMELAQKLQNEEQEHLTDAE
nr:hypothetical protein [Tanacetum cinerariifolium]